MTRVFEDPVEALTALQEMAGDKKPGLWRVNVHGNVKRYVLADSLHKARLAAVPDGELVNMKEAVAILIERHRREDGTE